MLGSLNLPLDRLPQWVPDRVRLYLSHTEAGVSFRALARDVGLNASTVLRQVRRFENRRDDPLLDDALDTLSRASRDGPPTDAPVPTDQDRKDPPGMTAPIRAQTLMTDETQLLREARRVLRRLVEPGSVLAFAPEMEKAVVLREFPDGRSKRTAVLDRATAQAFSLKDWIACRKAGRISTYEITSAGRAALRRMMDEDERRAAAERGTPGGTLGGIPGLAEAATPFADQHRSWGTRTVVDEDGPRRAR